ncbi:hypothetical protein AX769_13610 [Frondihabitans sp. PAMC 28766]|uniref:three-helix bundle dimerization domain-containing protein n=1 Tax=Frondihabitans sp. PAMC 28766 TaxID=1795630 RepID=UPI00078BBEC7|nr:hypothetical protein [Frondihabitans sp. PAMC 28766]AMM20980.1 hypothetical protein AX769_13610 [Frondihabitans sp. PAMC 28766]
MAATVRELTVAQVTALLTRRFPLKNISHVTETVAEEYDALAGNPIRIYVPNLVEHAARHRLSREPAFTT